MSPSSVNEPVTSVVLK